MEKELAEKLNGIFKTRVNHCDKGIIDEGDVLLGYASNAECSVQFRAKAPELVSTLLSKADDKGNFYGRKDITGLLDDQIHPINLKFLPADPDYDPELAMEEDLDMNLKRSLRFRFLHPSSPSDVFIVDDNYKFSPSDPLFAHESDIGQGPSLEDFARVIAALERWSDIDFHAFVPAPALKAE